MFRTKPACRYRSAYTCFASCKKPFNKTCKGTTYAPCPCWNITMSQRKHLLRAADSDPSGLKHQTPTLQIYSLHRSTNDMKHAKCKHTGYRFFGNGRKFFCRNSIGHTSVRSKALVLSRRKGGRVSQTWPRWRGIQQFNFREACYGCFCQSTVSPVVTLV